MVPATPTPLRLTVLRPPQPVVAILSVARRVPVAFGLKVRLIVQLAPGASELPQLLDCANLPAFVPEIETLVVNKDPLPVFCRVTEWAGLVVLMTTDPKATLLTETPHTPWLCVPEKATVLEAESTASVIKAARRIPIVG